MEFLSYYMSGAGGVRSIAVGLAVLLWALPAGAEPIIKRAVAYYDVTGATVPELHDDILRKGPLEKGRRFWGQTEWNVIWKFKYRPGASGCVIVSSSTELKLTITMPRLNGGTAAVEDSFNKSMESLMVHENGHVDIAIKTARRIDQRLRAMPPEKSCDRLVAATRAAGSALIEEGKRENEAYDLKTRHGASQGLELPR